MCPKKHDIGSLPNNTRYAVKFQHDARLQNWAIAVQEHANMSDVVEGSAYFASVALSSGLFNVIRYCFCLKEWRMCGKSCAAFGSGAGRKHKGASP
jgi:hypothetical protein